MKTDRKMTDEDVLNDKTKNLIAIGAATAANCIPCFEHLYEKAVNSGITNAEIKWAAEIAGQVKSGAHIAIKNYMNEILETGTTESLPGEKTDNNSCCC